MLSTDISCPWVYHIENALSAGNGTEFNTTVVYTCKLNTDNSIDGTHRHIDGHIIKTITCQQDSEWSESTVSCECKYFSWNKCMLVWKLTIN